MKLEEKRWREELDFKKKTEEREQACRGVHWQPP